MAETITVTQAGPGIVILGGSVSQTAVTHYPSGEINLVGSPSPQANYLVGNYTAEQAEASGAKFFVQTGLGPDGNDFTIWIDEDLAWV